MPKKLTPKLIDSLPAAQTKRYEVRDLLVTGLHVRVSVSGAKVFYLSARVANRLRRIKLGSYPIISLLDARERARTVLRDIQLGQFEVPEDKASTEQAPTLAETIPQFIELYCKPRNRDWRGTQSILRKFFALRDKPIDAIRRADVVRVLDEIVANGTPLRANRALAALKKLMNWCVDRGIIEHSPIAKLRMPAEEVSRDRVLSDCELHLCWETAGAEGYPFGPCVQLLVLTGQRRGEVSEMRWSELDLENALWTIPRTRVKNGTTHIVPLPQFVLAVIQSLPRFAGSDYVFTTTGKTPISGFGRLKDRLDAALPNGTEDWRFHDLRRTAATNMAMLRVSPHIIEAVLNHKSGIVSGVAAVYNRHAYLDEKREALEVWASRVQGIVTDVKSRTTSPRAEASLTGSPHQLSSDAHHFGQPPS